MLLSNYRVYEQPARSVGYNWGDFHENDTTSKKTTPINPYFSRRLIMHKYTLSDQRQIHQKALIQGVTYK